MRAIVCGGRNFNDAALVYQTLNALDIDTVISGNAPGADTIGERWAYENEKHIERFPADWARLGRSAGPIRNKQMLVEGKPDIVVAFQGGSGTKNMVAQARASGVLIMEIY